MSSANRIPFRGHRDVRADACVTHRHQRHAHPRAFALATSLAVALDRHLQVAEVRGAR